MRLLLVLLVGCASKPAPPVHRATCDPFAEGNPACSQACPIDAPNDWPACAALTAELPSRGYVCKNLHPRTCRLEPRPCPPGGCKSIETRILAVRVVGNHLELTIGAGEDQGVTTEWRAQLLRERGGKPIVGGQVLLTSVAARHSIGTTSLTFDQIPRTLHVRLDP